MLVGGLPALPGAAAAIAGRSTCGSGSGSRSRTDGPERSTERRRRREIGELAADTADFARDGAQGGAVGRGQRGQGHSSLTGSAGTQAPARMRQRIRDSVTKQSRRIDASSASRTFAEAASSSRTSVDIAREPADNAAHRAIFTTGSKAASFRSTASACVAKTRSRDGKVARTAVASCSMAWRA